MSNKKNKRKPAADSEPVAAAAPVPTPIPAAATPATAPTTPAAAAPAAAPTTSATAAPAYNPQLVIPIPDSEYAVQNSEWFREKKAELENGTDHQKAILMVAEKVTADAYNAYKTMCDGFFEKMITLVFESELYKQNRVDAYLRKIGEPVNWRVRPSESNIRVHKYGNGEDIGQHLLLLFATFVYRTKIYNELKCNNINIEKFNDFEKEMRMLLDVFSGERIPR